MHLLRTRRVERTVLEMLILAGLAAILTALLIPAVVDSDHADSSVKSRSSVTTQAVDS